MPRQPYLNRLTIKRLALGMTLGLILVIAWASLTSSTDLPSVPGSDKLKHFAAYMGLAIPLLVWLGARRVLPAFAVLLALGAGLEVAQGLSGMGRYADVLDMFANCAGAMTGLMLSAALLQIDVAYAKRA